MSISAAGFQPTQEKPSKSYASAVNESIPPTPDESRQVTVADFWGHRKLHDIVIETYDSESKYSAVSAPDQVEYMYM